MADTFILTTSTRFMLKVNVRSSYRLPSLGNMQSIRLGLILSAKSKTFCYANASNSAWANAKHKPPWAMGLLHLRSMSQGKCRAQAWICPAHSATVCVTGSSSLLVMLGGLWCLLTALRLQGDDVHADNTQAQSLSKFSFNSLTHLSLVSVSKILFRGCKSPPKCKLP